jgi:hypothetical protein
VALGRRGAAAHRNPAGLAAEMVGGGAWEDHGFTLELGDAGIWAEGRPVSGAQAATGGHRREPGCGAAGARLRSGEARAVVLGFGVAA